MSATLYYPPHHDPCYEAIVSEISHYLFSSSNHLLHSPLSVSRYGSGGPPSSEYVALMKNVIKARGGGGECLDSHLEGGSVAAEKASQPASARPLPCESALLAESPSSPHAPHSSPSSFFTPSLGDTYYNSNEPLAAAVQRHHEWLCKAIIKYFNLTRPGPAEVVELPISVGKEEPIVGPNPPGSPGNYSCVVIKRVLQPTRATATALLILLVSSTNAFEAVRLLVEYCGADVYGRYTDDARARHSGDERNELASSTTEKSDPVGEGEERKGAEKKGSNYENNHDAALSIDAAPRPQKEIGGAYVEYSYSFEKGVLTKTESFAFYPDTNKWLSDKRRQFAKNKGHDGIDVEDDTTTETPSLKENARQPTAHDPIEAPSSSSDQRAFLAWPTPLHFAAKAGRAEMCILVIALANIYVQYENRLPSDYDYPPQGTVVATPLSTATTPQATIDIIRSFIVPPLRLYYHDSIAAPTPTPTPTPTPYCSTLEKESSYSSTTLPSSSSASISTLPTAALTGSATPLPPLTQQRLLTRFVESATSEGSARAPSNPTVPSDPNGSTSAVGSDKDNINDIAVVYGVKALLLSTPISIDFVGMTTNSGRTPVHYAARSGGGRVAAALSVAFRSFVVVPEKSTSLCEESVDNAHIVVGDGGGAPPPTAVDDDHKKGVDTYTNVHEAENATTADPQFLPNYLFVDVNVRDHIQGSTPLHEACLQGRIGMIKLLLQLNEAAPENEEVLGCSSGIHRIPIKSATSSACVAQIVSKLPPLWLKASSGIPDVQGNTALHLACRVLKGTAFESTLFESLISSAVSSYSFYGDDAGGGADRDATTMCAASHRDGEVSTTTPRADATPAPPFTSTSDSDSNKKADGQTSRTSKMMKNVRLCVGRGLGINAKTKAQYSSLHTAVCFGNVEAVRALLEFRKGGCGECHEGIILLRPPLVVRDETEGGQEKGSTTALNKPLFSMDCPRCHCDVNAVAVLRRTALHLACVDRYPSMEIIKLLLEHGASVSAVDAKGQTPLQCALRYVRSMPPPTHHTPPDGDAVSLPASSVFSLLADYGAT